MKSQSILLSQSSVQKKEPEIIKNEAFHNMWFKWNQVFRSIDPTIGRNQLITILRYEGYLGRNHKPQIYGRHAYIFRRQTYERKWRTDKHLITEYYVSGKGLAEMKAKIDEKRAAGSGI